MSYLRCSVCLYLQLFVAGLMSYLLVLFVSVCVYWYPTLIMFCFCFVCVRLVFVPYVASFSGLFILHCLFGIL